MTGLMSLNAWCAWWLLALVWLVIRGLLRRADAAAQRTARPSATVYPAGAEVSASIVPRHAGEPQRQA